MSRLRFNNLSGTAAGNPITLASAGATTATWTSTPGFPTITGPDYAAIVVEPDTGAEEIVYLTAFTAGATTGTVTRGQEGSSAATHTAKPWVHGPTTADFNAPMALTGTDPATVPLTVTGDEVQMAGLLNVIGDGRARSIWTGGPANTNLIFFAATPGTAGNALSVVIDSLGPSQPTTTVAVVGTVITVYQSTNGSNQPTETANQIIAAVTASGPASALIIAANAPGSTGAGVLNWNIVSDNPGGVMAGGSDVPTGLTVDQFGRVTITASGSNFTAGLTLVGGSAADATDAVYMRNTGGDLFFVAAADGESTFFSLNPSGFAFSAIDNLGGTGPLVIFIASINGRCLYNKDGSFVVAAIDPTTGQFRVRNDGTFGAVAPVAPADGALVNGEMALWFDATNGAAKLKIKAKTANGTVVTGQVALS